MNTIKAIAVKDLRLLLRDRLSAFFVLGFPILMGLFFGMMMGVGGPSTRGKMKFAIVDQDHSPVSQQFVELLQSNQNLEIETASLDEAQESVRRGTRVGMLVIPSKFGESAGILWQTPPQLQLGMDPSRAAESAMIQGFVMEAMGKLVAFRFQNPDQFKPFVEASLEEVKNSQQINPLRRQLLAGFFGSLLEVLDTTKELQQQRSESAEADDAAGPRQVQFADIRQLDVTRELDPKSIQAQVKKLRSRWDISFPQAMVWGVLGCVAGFSLSIARERTQGTLLRLRVAPLSQLNMLSGKAVACFLASVGVITLLNVVAYVLGMRALSIPKLVVAGMATSFCFVGIMMTLATVGKSEESVSGIGWATNMVMAMIGGCMVPAMFMPGFIQRLSVFSPVFWSIRAIEGAIWRDFSWHELAPSLVILCLVGVAGLITGTAILTRRQ